MCYAATSHMPLKLGVIQIQKDKEGSNLIEIILGSIIGTVVSLIIAEMYHRRSSRGLKREIDLLEQTKSLERGQVYG